MNSRSEARERLTAYKLDLIASITENSGNLFLEEKINILWEEKLAIFALSELSERLDSVDGPERRLVLWQVLGARDLKVALHFTPWILSFGRHWSNFWVGDTLLRRRVFVVVHYLNNVSLLLFVFLEGFWVALAFHGLKIGAGEGFELWQKRLVILGIEPRQMDLESIVLPLHHTTCVASSLRIFHF